MERGLMGLWLDRLRTPIAAPEPPALRRTRIVWMIACMALGTGVLFVGPLTRMLGRAAPCLLGALLVASGLLTALYLARKHRVESACSASTYTSTSTPTGAPAAEEAG